MSAKRVGYFGGTFDPPHLGHEILAQEAFYQLQLDSLRWLITPDPPHKRVQPISPVQSRLEMLQLVLRRYPAFEISRLDLDRPAPHFAADSVVLAKEREPAIELVYIMGEDSLQDLPGWHEPERFLSALNLLVIAPRPGVSADRQELEDRLPGISGKVVFLTDVMFEISSSLIRERCKNGAPYRHFLAREVADYIEEHLLYQ